MSVVGAEQENHNNSLEPCAHTNAKARLDKWRQALSLEKGSYPGGTLDAPKHRLTLLKVFGDAPKLSDLCFAQPVCVADVLVDGPQAVVDQAFNDLAGLNGGIGGPEALRASVEPIKARVDIALGLAEISGQFSAVKASQIRCVFAEQLIEVVVAWLLRSAIDREEIDIKFEEHVPCGVFVLAGSDFAHYGLAPFGPLEVAIFYEPSLFSGRAASMAERSFVRISEEFREVLEGRPGGQAIFNLVSPLKGGALSPGFTENSERARAAQSNSQETRFRAFVSTARVIAGDRQAGGEFLEASEQAIWGADEPLRTLLDAPAFNDERSEFRKLANILRYGLGCVRPIFRAAPIEEAFEKASDVGILPHDRAVRLSAGDAFAASMKSLSHLISGGNDAPLNSQQRESLAALMGYPDEASLEAVWRGLQADAQSTLPWLMDGPQQAFQRYKVVENSSSDANKLENLGFSDGSALGGFVDAWVGLHHDPSKTRFAQIAPGLLTAFGEMQYPDEAVTLFDNLLNVEETRLDVLRYVGQETPAREGLVAALGAFGPAVTPLTQTAHGVERLLSERAPNAYSTASEWVEWFGTPDKGATQQQIAEWRREAIGTLAVNAVHGAIDFQRVADTLTSIEDKTISRLVQSLDLPCDEDDLAMHRIEGPCDGQPGTRAMLGFITTKEKTENIEKAAYAISNAIHGLDQDYFAIKIDMNHRPGGAEGMLCPDEERFKWYLQSEAVAKDQILFTRARPIAGSEAAQAASEKILRLAVSNPKRSDVLMRDLDRVRAQEARKAPASSYWEFDKVDGGIADIELIISSLIYRHGGALPGLKTGDAVHALDELARAGVLKADVATTLRDARAFWRGLSTVKTLAAWGTPNTSPVRPQFGEILARAAKVSDFSQIRPLMRGYVEDVNRIYANLVLGRPANSFAVNG